MDQDHVKGYVKQIFVDEIKKRKNKEEEEIRKNDTQNASATFFCLSKITNLCAFCAIRPLSTHPRPVVGAKCSQLIVIKTDLHCTLSYLCATESPLPEIVLSDASQHLISGFFSGCRVQIHLSRFLLLQKILPLRFWHPR